MNADDKIQEVGILKMLWDKDPSGNWHIHALKGLTLKPKPGFDSDFFAFQSEMEMLTDRPLLKNRYGWLTSFGPTDFLVKQSIVPVAAWVEGEPIIRCIGTAFIISCSGYLMTACHVLLDPHESRYGRAVRSDNSIRFPPGMRFGVLIPVRGCYKFR